MAISFVEYTADGVTDTFAVTFPVLRRDEVHVFVNGVELDPSDFVLNAGGTSVELDVTPADQDRVKIERETVITPDSARPVVYIDGTGFNARNLNRILTYLLHAVQENADGLTRALMEDDIDPSKWDAEFKTIKDLGAPLEANDAARLADLLALQTATGNLPPVTSLNTRSMLMVVGGVWSIVTPPQVIAGLDLGTAALLDVGTGPNNVVQLDGAGLLPAVDGSQLTNLPTGGPGGGLASVKTLVVRFTSGAILNNISATWNTDSGGTLGRLDISAAQLLAGSVFMGGDVTVDTTNNFITLVTDATYEVVVEAELANKDTGASGNVDFKFCNTFGTAIYSSSTHTFEAKPATASYSSKLMIRQTFIFVAGTTAGLTLCLKARHSSTGGQVWALGEGTQVTIRRLT